VIDDQLNFTDHIARTANIRRIRPFLSEHATQLLVQALVLFRLDYCNALLAGLPACSVKPQELTQNAARVVFNGLEHTSLLSSQNCTGCSCLSHQIQVTDFCPQNNNPWLWSLYLNLLLQAMPSRNLCSASECRLVVPSQRGTKSLSHIFSWSIPCWWNDLPNSTRAAES